MQLHGSTCFVVFPVDGGWGWGGGGQAYCLLLFLRCLHSDSLLFLLGPDRPSSTVMLNNNYRLLNLTQYCVTETFLVDKKIIARIMFAGEREGLGTRLKCAKINLPYGATESRLEYGVFSAVFTGQNCNNNNNNNNYTLSSKIMGK